MSDTDQLVPHPLVEALPLMTPEEYQQLKHDMDISGQQEAIVLFEGKILDGRNRHRACLELGREPRCREFEGDQKAAFSYVISANLYRRQLSSSQKAVVALNILPCIQEDLQEQRIETLKGKAKTTKDVELWAEPAPPPEVKEIRTQRLAADVLNVADRYVANAAVLQEKAPEMVKDVLSGEISLPKALKSLKQEAEDPVRKELKGIRRTLKSLAQKAGNYPSLLPLLDTLQQELDRLADEP